MDEPLADWFSLPAGECGWLLRVRRAWTMERPHRHRELEVNLVTSGRAAYLVGDVRVELLPGRLLWLVPGQRHHFVDASPDFAFWLGVFGADLAASACEDTPAAALLHGTPFGCLYRTLSEPHRLERAFESVASSGLASRSQGLKWVLLLAWEAYEGASDAPTRALHPSVAKAVALLKAGEREWTLHALADAVGLSPTYLSALFREEVGVGLAEFRNRVRLERYGLLLARGGLGIEEAARAAGFGSYAQFYRVVCAATGASPSGERRSGR